MTRAWGLVEQANVQFLVAVPDAAVDQPAEIFCALSIDGWPEHGRALKKLAPGLYSATWSLPMGQLVEYKFTRFSAWKSVEKSADGGEIPNRTYMVRGGTGEQTVLHQVARWADRTPNPARSVEINTPGSGAPPRAITRSGDIRVHHRVFSPQLKNERTVLVYLPPNYDSEPERRYPVLYLHDGNNVFDAATSFTGVEWGVDEAAETLIAAKRIEPLIIVAIYNNEHRLEEYTPFADAKFGGGRGDLYLAFLCETLKPLIDKTYRTRAERAATGIGGSSLGGLISLYAAVKRPDVFSRAAVVSPALWWADLKILDVVRAAPPPSARVWIDIGTAEGESGGRLEQFAEAVEHCRKLAVVLEAAGLREPENFRLQVVAGGRHHESAWAARAGEILEYLYARPKPSAPPAASAPTRGAAREERPASAPAGRAALPRSERSATDAAGARRKPTAPREKSGKRTNRR